jgi:ABC-type uncharacterized transport system ATPase subunit
MTPRHGVPDLRGPDHEVPVGSLEGAGFREAHTPPGPAAIRTSGLSKHYRKVPALTDCTITVPEGRITALIGPNGAGKTTLLRLLAGLAVPTAGEMTVNGGIPRQDPAFLADIGFLAQEIRCTGGCPPPTTPAPART